MLATAPGFGRPRPDRLGEANGLHVVRWTADEIEIETRIWRSGRFEPRMRETRTPSLGVVILADPWHHATAVSALSEGDWGLRDRAER